MDLDTDPGGPKTRGSGFGSGTLLPCRRQVAETEIRRRRPLLTPIGQNAREQQAGHQGLAAGLAIKNHPKKPTKNEFFGFVKFLIFYENNTNFPL
jgi:hypothetical protein